MHMRSSKSTRYIICYMKAFHTKWVTADTCVFYDSCQNGELGPEFPQSCS